MVPYDASASVPMIIHDARPGRQNPSAGPEIYHPTQLIDIYPTLVELCKLPEKPYLDGKSLLPLLKNPEANWDRPAVMTMGRGNHAVRSELWRYIRAKHSADYRMRRLFRLWRTWRKRPSTRPLVVYAIWELCYRVLPDRVLNRLFLSLRPLSHSVRAARRRAAEA